MVWFRTASPLGLVCGECRWLGKYCLYICTVGQGVLSLNKFPENNCYDSIGFQTKIFIDAEHNFKQLVLWFMPKKCESFLRNHFLG